MSTTQQTNAIGYIEFTNYGEVWSMYTPTNTPNKQVDSLIYSAFANDEIINSYDDSTIDCYSASLDEYSSNQYPDTIQYVTSNSSCTKTCYFTFVQGSTRPEFTFYLYSNGTDLSESSSTKFKCIPTFNEIVYYGCCGLRDDSDIVDVFMQGSSNVWYFNFNMSTNTVTTPFSVNGNYLISWFNDAGTCGDFAAVNCVYYDTVNGYNTSIIISVNIKTNEISQIDPSVGDPNGVLTPGCISNGSYFVALLGDVYKVDLINKTTDLYNQSEMLNENDYIQNIIVDTSGKHVITIVNSVSSYGNNNNNNNQE